ncbi:MAG TPA: plastocyanin/azurin family copper-binding protein [Rhodocyclaceae bacterium]|nr:plastocyanin/azurin family copper-binding protein [Rhodocyclaceae bacterium]
MRHELALGTCKLLDEHAALMAKFPDMAHGGPYVAHVGIGITQDLVWTFNRPGTFDFACLIAGHSQAGMKGQVTVASK